MSDSDDPRSNRQRPLLIVVVAGVILLAVVAAAIAVSRKGDDNPAAGLTVEWGGSEGHPCCVYNPEDDTVDAEVIVKGEAAGKDTVTVTITAYADENTSKPVGSSTSTVEVEGTVDEPLVITIPVTRAPHIDEDGIVACSLAVTDG